MCIEINFVFLFLGPLVQKQYATWGNRHNSYDEAKQPSYFNFKLNQIWRRFWKLFVCCRKFLGDFQVSYNQISTSLVFSSSYIQTWSFMIMHNNTFYILDEWHWLKTYWIRICFEKLYPYRFHCIHVVLHHTYAFEIIFFCKQIHRDIDSNCKISKCESECAYAWVLGERKFYIVMHIKQNLCVRVLERRYFLLYLEQRQ